MADPSGGDPGRRGGHGADAASVPERADADDSDGRRPAGGGHPQPVRRAVRNQGGQKAVRCTVTPGGQIPGQTEQRRCLTRLLCILYPYKQTNSEYHLKRTGVCPIYKHQFNKNLFILFTLSSSFFA